MYLTAGVEWIYRINLSDEVNVFEKLKLTRRKIEEEDLTDFIKVLKDADKKKKAHYQLKFNRLD